MLNIHAVPYSAASFIWAKNWQKKRINRYVGAFYQQYQPYDNENDDDYYYYDNDGLVYGISHCCSLNIKSSVVIHNLHPNMLYAWVSLSVCVCLNTMK